MSIYKLSIPCNSGVLRLTQKVTLECHHYPEDLIIAKFFPTDYSKDDKRYEILLNRGVKFASTVLATVVDALRLEIDKHPNCSVGFVGAPRYLIVSSRRGQLIYRQQDEGSQDPSRRFEVYRRLANTLVDPDAFHLHERKEDNAILLVNTKHSVAQSKSYADAAYRMMKDEFPDFSTTTA